MLRELQPGDPQVIGPYRLRGRLGRGGMGQVFLGISAGGRLVAVKVVRDDFATDPEFRARFEEDRFFTASGKPDHFRFDLEGYAADRLGQAGIADVTKLGLCTYPQDQGFFSFRRTTHRGEADYGRQISAIVLTS